VDAPPLPKLLHMEQIARLIDADARSLDARVVAVVGGVAAGCIVHRFTYWYTARPPVHEAIVLAPAA
jgi:hypothetical protein